MPYTYAIADLHGRYDLLLKAIAVIENDAGPEGGILVCMGDFVDRGPQARQIIEHFIAGPSKTNWQWIILQGNHEKMMIDALDFKGIIGSSFNHWMYNGGGQTLGSYGYLDGDKIEPLKVPQYHINWLKNLPLTYVDEQRIFVHAGVPFDKPVEEVKPQTLQWMLYPSEERYSDAEYHPDEPHCSGLHIVHGHHQSETHPLLLKHRTNLDSFAWYCGRLAIGKFNNQSAGPINIFNVVGERCR